MAVISSSLKVTAQANNGIGMQFLDSYCYNRLKIADNIQGALHHYFLVVYHKGNAQYRDFNFATVV